MDNLRDVVESQRYSFELAQIERDKRLSDDVTEAATFLLARHPEWGARIPATQLWIWPVRIRGVEYVIFYSYDDNTVVLQSIMATTGDAVN